MAPLPKTFSRQAIEIRAAMNEGRTEDARTAIVELLQAGIADAAVQGLAAEMLKPQKRTRGRQKASPRHWHAIGQGFHELRDDGASYEAALEAMAGRFGFSENHIRTCIASYDKAREIASRPK